MVVRIVEGRVGSNIQCVLIAGWPNALSLGHNHPSLTRICEVVYSS